MDENELKEEEFKDVPHTEWNAEAYYASKHSIQGYVKRVSTAKLLEVLWQHGRPDGIKYPEVVLNLVSDELRIRKKEEAEILEKLKRDNISTNYE